MGEKAFFLRQGAREAREQNLINGVFMQNKGGGATGSVTNSVTSLCRFERSHAIILLVHHTRRIRGTKPGGRIYSDMANPAEVITVTCRSMRCPPSTAPAQLVISTYIH